MLAIVLISAAVLTVAYFTYGSLLTRLLGLRDDAKVPSIEQRDDVDYVPLEAAPLLNQHFSAIAAAGPIAGPIIAGAMFGWGPALIWILIGAIFVGGVHDLTALIASVRHRGRSVAEVVRQHMSHRSFLLFLVFIWFALVYIIVAFTDITAASFVGTETLDDGSTVSGGGIATSSLLYLVLPVIMGVLIRYTRLSMGMATIIFLPLVVLAIVAGQWIPFDLTAMLRQVWPEITDSTTHKIWDVLLLVYCCIASVVPMWALLQPRGQLGGWFLYAALFGGAAGLIISSVSGNAPIQLSAFTGWTTDAGNSLVPILFITIACGACSGFHALVASGTTSKQLRTETDAKVIGYGAMLMEGMVAIVALCCVMMASGELASKSPNVVYAHGIGAFLTTLGIPLNVGIAFALMAFTTFVYDTLDVCTRLGRYIVQELTGWHDAKGRWFGTILTAGVPIFFVLRTVTDAAGNPVPAWKTFWLLFGASNQLLAALTLLCVTVWLWQTRRAMWVWFVTGIPTVFMYVMSAWALIDITVAAVQKGGWTDPVVWVSSVLIVLAALMLVEAVATIVRINTRPDEPQLVEPAAATA